MSSLWQIGRFRRRALALVALAAVLFLGSGGTFVHKHTAGPENPCHVCQMAHAPALAPSTPTLIAEPETLTRFSASNHFAAPSDAFELHRASRAPPLA